jgi:hypothetical protein
LKRRIPATINIQTTKLAPPSSQFQNPYSAPEILSALREMKKKGNRRSSVAELLETPLPKAASPPPPSPTNESPKSGIFISSKNALSASKIKKGKSLPTALNSLSSVSDLKDLASSRLDDLKRHIDRSHSEILKELDSSQSRLHKRFKVSLSLSLEKDCVCVYWQFEFC